MSSTNEVSEIDAKIESSSFESVGRDTFGRVQFISDEKVRVNVLIRLISTYTMKSPGLDFCVLNKKLKLVNVLEGHEIGKEVVEDMIMITSEFEWPLNIEENVEYTIKIDIREECEGRFQGFVTEPFTIKKKSSESTERGVEKEKEDVSKSERKSEENVVRTDLAPNTSPERTRLNSQANVPTFPNDIPPNETNMNLLQPPNNPQLPSHTKQLNDADFMEWCILSTGCFQNQLEFQTWPEYEPSRDAEIRLAGFGYFFHHRTKTWKLISTIFPNLMDFIEYLLKKFGISKTQYRDWIRRNGIQGEAQRQERERNSRRELDRRRDDEEGEEEEEEEGEDPLF